LSVVGIESRHVQIIDEVYKLELADWSISTTSLFLKLLLQNILQKERVSVEVEVNNLHNVLVSSSGQLI